MKKFTKKIMAFLVVGAISLGMIGCGASNNSDKQSSNEKKDNVQTSNESGKTTSDLPDTITIIVPWGVGGGVDVVSRKVASIMEKQTGKAVVVENHTGASGTIAMGDLLDAKTDGSVLIVANGPLFTLTPYFVDVDYKFEDITPLVGMRTVDCILMTNPKKSNINTLEELIEYGKKNGINFGTSGGPGNDQYTMVTALFKQLGIKAEPIVYDGQNETVNALVGEHVDLSIASPPTYHEQAKEGNVKPIATLTPEGSKTPFGDIPSVKTLDGIDIEFVGMDYFACSSKVPQEKADALKKALEDVYADEEFKAYMQEMGFDFWGVGTEEIVDAVNKQMEAMKKYSQQ